MTFNETPTNINSDQENYTSVPHAIGLNVLMNLGEGIGAIITGQPYSVYRVGSTSNGDYIQAANQFKLRWMVQRQKLKASDVGQENAAKNMTFFYQVMGNFLPFQVGDVFVLNAPFFSTGQEEVAYSTHQIIAFCFTQGNPLYNKNAARLDRQIIVKRADVYARADNMIDQTSTQARSLVCQNGSWSLTNNSQFPSLIPAGFMQIARPRGNQYSQVPDGTMRTQWACYVPPLQGFVFREGDIIMEAYLDPNDVNALGPVTQARYRVVNPFWQDTGTSGSQLLLEREVSSKGK